MSQTTAPRHFASAGIVQASPGYRELRIDIREQGAADPFALIVVRPSHDTSDVLAAFGWRIVGDLEYVAGPNEERAEVERCEPADHGGAETMRNTVRREIRARVLAILADPTARHFHPVLLNGDHSLDPIGWTFRVGKGGDRTYGWVTAAGSLSLGVPSVADATRDVRHAHMMQRVASPVAEMTWTQLNGKTGPELAELLYGVRNGTPLDLADEDTPGRRTVRSLTPMKSRQLAPNRCVHNQYAREDVTGDPVTACARKDAAVSAGVFNDEGCVEAYDCAVQAANAAAEMNEAARDLGHDDEALTWAVVCREHEEQRADACEECPTDGSEDLTGDEDVDEPTTAEVPLFRAGDRIVCADGVTRLVEGMAPAIAGEPARVIVKGGAEWIAENCRRANRDDVLAAHRRCNAAGARVRTNPNPDDPEWRAALDELTEALAFLRQADPTVRVALDEDDAQEAARRVHPDACQFQPVHHLGEDEPCAWSFLTGYGAGARYGIVTRLAEVSPVGLYEYRTTAERAYRQHLVEGRVTA